MLHQIIDVLKSSPAAAWEVTETITEGWEFYFIRHALDQNRVKNLEQYTVKVYHRSEDGQFLGSAAGEIPPTAEEAEIRREEAAAGQILPDGRPADGSYDCYARDILAAAELILKECGGNAP